MFRTHLCTLEDNYKDKIKCREDVMNMRAAGKITDQECTMLEGFLINTNRNNMDPQPTDMDKQKVAQAYYKGTYILTYIKCDDVFSV